MNNPQDLGDHDQLQAELDTQSYRNRRIRINLKVDIIPMFDISKVEQWYCL
jgi:hypothetical protein